jgi:uncharacterized protein YjiS (DUF1127 family)
MQATVTLSKAAAPNLFWAPLRAISRWYREYRTAAVLSTLDDRMLRDIGVNRCAMFFAARWHCTGSGSD